MNRWIGLLVTSFCVAGTGCSSLGFSSYPSSHLMTQETKRVLDSSPRRSAVPRELRQEVLPPRTLEPGDELLVETPELDSAVRVPADQRVMGDGTIDLSEFGRVVVAGLTLEQAEAAIQEILLDSGADPTVVNVRLIEPGDRYYVIGEVNSPGSYPLTGNETVLDGLMAAGGLTSRAAVCEMLLARPTEPGSCRVTMPVCYRVITQLGDTTTNYQLRPGDRIFVARQSMWDELFFWRSGQTCSRCCDQHRACRDATSAMGWIASFGAVAESWISPPPVGEALETGVEAGREPIPDGLPDGPESPSDRAAPGALPEGAGELDFSAFLEPR